LRAGEDVEPELLAKVSTMGHPPRVMGIYRSDALPRGVDPVSLALWHVADPGNLGTILRTADAFGASVALSASCADPTGPKAVRASAGAVFRVPLVGFDEPDGKRIALVSHGGRPLAQLDPGVPVTYVLGAEREGLPEDVVAACDESATIPLAPGAESLNVAIAAAIALYEFRRPS
jgi:TrmH family RNA methyltransferase